MKIAILFTALLSAFATTTPTPVEHTATYRYLFEDGQILLTFTIDEATLESFDFFGQCGHLSQAEMLCLANYLNAQINLKAGNTILDFELLGTRKNDQRLTVEMIAPGYYLDSPQFTLTNHCFLEFEADFVNRIYIMDNGDTKSYLLDGDKTDLSLRRN